MSESSMLRLAMVLTDNAATTLDNYICKLVEAILYDADEDSLDLIETCSRIKEVFGFEFGTSEISTALKRKGKNRVLYTSGQYAISSKASSQLSTQINPVDLLKTYISSFSETCELSFNESVFLDALLKYLYYCFNSTKQNLLGLLQHQGVPVDVSFSPTNEDVMLINKFITWENDAKNELMYRIIVSSYEYCMLTTKQDSLLSQRVFKGKRFFLDTNIIFRMAGINKDERKFVTDSFVKKCNEVGIELCYTSETVSELFRVVDAQIKYIRHLTYGQRPIQPGLIQKLDDGYEVNDFYSIYYNWSKENSNHFTDLISFQQHLHGLVLAALSELEFVQVDNQRYTTNSDEFTNMCNSLKEYKNAKRPTKNVTEASLQTDINNILYTRLRRSRSQAQTLWQTNDFFVSADQILTAWAGETYPGVPVVVIPSTWLSIILRFSGRTSDDYKSYCLFMSLRQHRSNSEKPSINAVRVMEELSQKTSEVAVKEKIITELIVNSREYQFNTDDDYETAIAKAFDKTLAEIKVSNEILMTDAQQQLRDSYQAEIDALEQNLSERSTAQEYTIRYAQNKANNKVDRFKKVAWLQSLLPFVGIAIFIATVCLWYKKVEPIHTWISAAGVFQSGFVTLIISALPTAVSNALKYLASAERKENLIKKYKRDAEENMKVPK